MRRLYDIRRVLGLPENKKVIVCPLPMHIHSNNPTPSFSIHVTRAGVQKWNCHGTCGNSGDVIDLVGFMQISGYQPKNGEHVKQALALLAGTISICPPPVVRKVEFILPNCAYKKYLPVGDQVVEYARTRGLTRETLERFQVGQNTLPSANWMTMPTIQKGRLHGIKMRVAGNANRRFRFMQVEGSVEGLFNFDKVNETRQPVAVVKAEITTMLLDQHGILACAPTGGESAYYKHEDLAAALAFSARRIVIGDNDENLKVRVKMQEAAARRAKLFLADLKFPPEKYKDVDDWVRAEPRAAIQTIKSWLEER
jgi:hypothetical protein